MLNLDEDEQFCKDWVERTIEEMTSNDDVFKPSFLTGTVVAGQVSSGIAIPDNLKIFLQGHGCNWMDIAPSTTRAQYKTSGPHVVYGGRLRQVFRLYDDTSRAFMSTFVPTTDPRLVCQV